MAPVADGSARAMQNGMESQHAVPDPAPQGPGARAPSRPCRRLYRCRLEKLAPLGIEGATSAGFQSLLDDNCPWLSNPACAALSAPLTRLRRIYLCHASRGRFIDPVARFHLGNGARIERLNWMGDTAERACESILWLDGQLPLRPRPHPKNVAAYSDGAMRPTPHALT